jgi:tetratricopeptide (TPR) repeat protein
MNKLVMGLAVGGALLAGCAAPPARQPLALQPLLRISHSPEQTAASWYQLGKYHQQRGAFDLALQAYDAAIAQDGRQLEPRNARATVLALQGRLAEAQQILQRLVADYSGAAHPHNNLGYVYLMQRDYPAAAIAFQRALALDPGAQRARNNLAVVQAATGHAAATAAAPMTAPATTTMAALPAAQAAKPAPRMELVLIEPHVYQLKLTAPAALRPVPAPQPSGPATALANAVKSRSGPGLAIVNGNGQAGMALQMKQLLARRGIAVSRLGNERPYRQRQTEIQYPSGREKEARALNHALKGIAVMLRLPHTAPRPDLRLVLGKDVALRAEAGHMLAAN